MSESRVLQLQPHDHAILATCAFAQLDFESTGRFKAELIAAAQQTPVLPVVVDLSRLEFMASLAIGALVDVANRFRSEKRRLVLVGLAPRIQEMMVKSAIQPLFEVHPTVERALSAPHS